MDIKYERPGVMEVVLDDADFAQLYSEDYCMCRNGLYGIVNSKTHIRLSYSDPPRASLDGDADVTVWLPRDTATDMPVEFTKADIGAWGDNIEARKDWFFGEDGGIRLVRAVQQVTES